MSKRTAIAAGAAGIVLTMEFIHAMSSSAYAQAACDRILPTVETVDVFQSAADAAPSKATEVVKLGSQLCKLAEQNGRYRISVEGEDVWVPTLQFEATPRHGTPLPSDRKVPPASVLVQQLACYFLECGSPSPTALAGLAAVSGAGRGFGLYRGLDFSGDDLLRLADHTLDTCSGACGGDLRCKAFTFNLDTKVCMLKSGFGQPVRHQDAISGALRDGRAAPVVPAAVMDVKHGTDYQGGNYNDQRDVSLDQCHDSCSRDTRCVAFSYVQSKRWCLLKSILPSPRRNGDVVSGAKLR